MFFTEILIFSKDGDLFLSETYREMTSIEKEMRKRILKPNIDTFDPAFKSRKGLNCNYIRKKDIFIGSTSLGLSNVYIFDVLERFSRILRDFCGEVNCKNIENNIVLVYEILNEFMDDGVVQIDSTTKMKALILMEVESNEDHGSKENNFNTSLLSTFPISDDVLHKLGMDLSPKTTSSQTAQRSVIERKTDQLRPSELFVDVIENLNAVCNQQGDLLDYEINGKIVLKNHLLNNPLIKMRFNHNQPSVFGSLMEHTFAVDVDTASLNDKNIACFHAKEGESTLLSYKCDKNLDVFKGGGEKIIPISIDHQISRKEHFDKVVTLELTLKPSLVNTSKITNLSVVATLYGGIDRIIPSMKNFSLEEECEVIYGDDMGGDGKHCKLNWKLQNISSNVPLKASFEIFGTKADFSFRTEVILLNYEISNYSLSRLNISALKFIDNTNAKTEINAKSWVRYITTSKSHILKINK